MANLVRRGKMGSRSLNKLLGTASGALPANGASMQEDLGGVRRSVFRFKDVAIAMADEAGVVAYGSKKFCDLPEGDIVIFAAVANLAITKSSAGVIAAFDGDFGVGTVAASNNATLATTEQNVIPTTPTPQAVSGATTAKGRLAAPVSLDGTGGALDLYLNLLVDDADHDVTTTPCNLIANGTITVVWATAGDF